jgi:tetratricopeptide (TPR) repeat protein
VPAVFWLFSYFAASTLPDSADGINVPFTRRVPACAAVLGAGLALSYRVAVSWRADQLIAAAHAADQRGATAAALADLSDAERLSPRNPEIPRFEGELLARPAAGSATGDWLEAAAHLERAVELDPFDQATWLRLAQIYRRLGRPDAAERVLQQASAYRSRA